MRGTSFKWLLGSIAAMALGAAPLHAAVIITQLGNQTDIETNAAHQLSDGGWRYSGTPKTYDPSGDNVLGTDGFSLFGISSTYTSLPSYVSSVSSSLATFSGGAYAQINDPTTSSPTAPSIQSGTLYLNGVAANTEVQMFQFTLTGTVPGSFQVGLLFDNVDNGVTATGNSFRITGSNGGDSGLLSVASPNNVPDWYFFNITGGQAGDVYTVFEDTGASPGNVLVGGVSFDSPVPEPTSLLLLGVGASGLLLRRSRRNREVAVV